MLKPSECFAGPFSGASGLTLILPRLDNEKLTLIVKFCDQLQAIFLDSGGDIAAFQSFPCDGNAYWNGLHVPNVEIELDEASLIGVYESNVPVGAMTRTGDKLVIQTRDQSWIKSLTVMDSLPVCAERQTASFLKWQIVLGSRNEKRILHRVDVTPPL